MPKSDTLPLSEGERKLVNDLRRMESQSNKSFTVTLLVQDGIWYYYYGQPQGKVKNIDKK